MSLETLFDKGNINNLVNQLLFKRIAGNSDVKDGYSIYASKILNMKCIADGDGKIVFGGFHYHVSGYMVIGGITYYGAIKKTPRYYGDNFGLLYYKEDGTSFRSYGEAGLSPLKDQISSLGLWDSFYSAYNKVDSRLTGGQYEFIKGVFSHVHEMLENHNDDPALLKNLLKQFIKGMEDLAAHPDDYLEFGSGGMGR